MSFTELPVLAPDSGAVEPLLTIAGAVVSAYVAFRLALRQDERKWSRERRADVYVDALVEASAELDWIQRELAVADGADPDSLDPLRDDRLVSKERRALGARLLAYGYRDVIVAHNNLSGAMLRASLFARTPASSQAHRFEIGRAFDAFERVIRDRLESDRRPWWQRRR